MKTAILQLCSIFLFFLTTSFVEKPHLIVGDWAAVDKTICTFPASDNLILYQWYFSSDEFTSIVSFTKEDKEYEYHLAYNIYENKEGYNKPIVVLKNFCDEKFIIIFLIEELSKSTLTLKFDIENSTKSIKISPKKFSLRRIAGPPENMD